MLDDSFIWAPWPIESVEDIIRFEEKYQELAKSAPDEWSPDARLVSHDFGDGSLCLMGRGHFKMMAEGSALKQEDAFIVAGCNQCESLVLHSFIGFESCLFRKDSYHSHIPPFAINLWKILDQALEKMPRCECEELYRACVYEDRDNFEIGELFEPGYSVTTSANSSWRDKSVNRYVIKPLAPEQTKARSIYPVFNKADEYQVSFLSTAQLIITAVDSWGEDKRVFYMREVR